MRNLIIFLASVVLVGAFGRTAHACSCFGPRMPCEEYGSAAAVFVGTPISVSEAKRRIDTKEIDWTPRAFKFQVEQSYLGNQNTEIEVFTGRGGGDCGYSFTLGKRYLVYAYASGNRLTTGICSRTKPFSQATEDLAFLGNLSSLPPGATIYGQLVPTAAKHQFSSDNIVVRIEGADVQRDVRPDANGRYQVAGLPPGKFTVTLQLPDKLITSRPEREVSISDRGCASAVFDVTDNGRISGKVIDAQGLPVARIVVSVLEPASDPRGRFVTLDRTDEEGRFNFSSIPAGKYLIGVNFNRFPEPNDPTNAYPPTFYPSANDQTGAEVISLAVGEKLIGLEIRIPLPRPKTVLTGQIVWADGKPVPAASLSVSDVTHGKSAIQYGVEVDQEGKFTITGYTGQQLILQARSGRPHVPSVPDTPMERTEPLRITLERSTHTVKIVITRLR